MTNEELVSIIQQGKKQFLVDLWAQVEGLVKWQAKRTMSGIRGMSSNCGVEFDDLYQSGYLALVKAVDTYKSDMGMTFAGWLIFYLRSAFAQVSGFCTQKQRCDPLRFSLSLNAPLKDEDGATFEDIQADPESSTGFEDIEQEIYIHGLREALEAELAQIPPREAEILRQRYYSDFPLEQVADAFRISVTRVQQLEAQGLKRLRNPQRLERLEAYVESRTPYFLQVGPAQFQRTHESSVEKIVLIRERLRRIGQEYDE